MEFKNLTPFPAIAFEGVDVEDRFFHVVAIRISYDLSLRTDIPTPSPGTTHQLILCDSPSQIAESDVYAGEPNKSHVLWESDLAPYKPKCDVIVLGTGHAPLGRPQKEFMVSFKMQDPPRPAPLPDPPRPLNPLMPPSPKEQSDYEQSLSEAKRRTKPGLVLINSSLRIIGPRYLQHRNFLMLSFAFIVRIMSLGTLKPSFWKLTRPRPCTAVPITWNNAFGGQLVIPLGDTKAARKVPKAHRLPIDKRDELSLGEPLVAYTRSILNPIGVGHASAWALKALKCKQLRAPQIENSKYSINSKLLWKLIQGKKNADQHPALQPAGWGVVGRGWPTRLPFAGTYDEKWLNERHPWLPKDFDFAYWNCATPDLQVHHLTGNEIITFTNMLPYNAPGIEIDASGQTKTCFRLPGHKPFLLLRFEEGMIVRLEPKLDTLIIDLESMKVEAVYRATMMKTDQALRVVEARAEMNNATLPRPRSRREVVHA